MPEMDPASRSLRARVAGYAALAKHGGHKQTEAARAVNPSSDAYWFAKTDPDLSDDERRARASFAKKSYFASLALKSARARRRAS